MLSKDLTSSLPVARANRLTPGILLPLYRALNSVRYGESLEITGRRRIRGSTENGPTPLRIPQEEEAAQAATCPAS